MFPKAKIPNKWPSEFAGKRKAGIAEAKGARLVGDYGNRMICLSAGGKFACFECGDADRFMGDFPSYLEKQSKLKVDPQGSKNGGDAVRKWEYVRKKEKVGGKVKFEYKCQVCRRWERQSEKYGNFRGKGGCVFKRERCKLRRVVSFNLANCLRGNRMGA